jgi:hypothetical protein
VKITHLAYRIAHEYRGGVVALSSMMGKNDRVMASKLNPNIDTHHLNIEELSMLADFTNTNIEVAQYFAQKQNAVVVELPNIPADSDMSLLDNYMDIMKELGQLSTEFQSDFADGNINTKEFERIARHVSQVQARLSAFQYSVKRIVR